MKDLMSVDSRCCLQSGCQYHARKEQLELPKELGRHEGDSNN